MSGLLTMLTRGVKGLSKAALDLDPADDGTIADRRRACAACPAATRTKHLGRVDLTILTPMSMCGACKCNLHAKTKLAGESCPWGKWPAKGDAA